MLSPEVWNFAPPRSSVTFNLCDSKEKIIKSIEKQLFHHHVSVTIPGAVVMPREIIDIMIEDNDFYRIHSIPPSEMFCKDFIDLFVKSGKLSALSIEASTNDDNFYAITPNGESILVLSKDLSQQVGLPNKNLSSDSFLVFVLDIVSEDFNKYEEIQKKLSSLDLLFDIILCWEPNDKNICPSSIANYFCQKGYLVKTCNIRYHQRVDYDISVPLFDSNTDTSDLLEWLGAYNLHCHLNCDNYISTFNYFDKTETPKQVCIANFTGFFPESCMRNLITKVHDIANENYSPDWIGVVIKGFDNSFINHRKYFEMIGDHHHAVIFKANAPNVVCFYCSEQKYKGNKKKYSQQL